LPTEELTSDNNGRSFMLTSTLSQRKENWMNNSDSTLKETFMLFQPWPQEDMLILSITETWSLRLQTVERHKSGISTKQQRPSELD
jgi:hypothetical protein